MKSIKPGRGPSGMSFIGSVVAIIFGIFWTIMAFKMTSGSTFGIVGSIFPLFGIVFIIVGIIQAVYHYKNATGKNRFSEFDITDSSEEGDPLDTLIKKEITVANEENKEKVQSDINYCPYCGTTIDSDYYFCPKCGKTIK